MIGNDDPHLDFDKRPHLEPWEKVILSDVTDRVRAGLYHLSPKPSEQMSDDSLFLLEIVQKYLVTK